MAHLGRGDPLLNFRDIHTWGFDFSPVLVSDLSAQDKCLISCLLREEKAEASTLFFHRVLFCVTHLTEVNQLSAFSGN